jgi:Predicted membrane protein
VTEASPTAPDERIVALDVLRGLALLGILVINVRVFAMPEAVLTNPTVYGEFTGANYAAWLAGHVFAEQTFLTLFSALFGAGVLLFTESKAQDGEPAVRLHLRRTAWLFVIGLGHAYLLWYGDILVSYALCGVAVVAARDWIPARQAKVGLAVLAVPSVLQVLTGLASGAAAVEAVWEPAAASIEREVTTYQGGWLEQMDHRIPTAFRRRQQALLAPQSGGLVASCYSGWRCSTWGCLLTTAPPGSIAGLRSGRLRVPE